mmetsp:Transcript_3561/g.13025  ORF Transcript_3561/g.13025 Transcript_3561/m.13025 type:complete len:200 (-) Transcript_3561:205-804(-)
MEANWETAYQSIGLGHRDQRHRQAVQGQPSAGLNTAAAAYHSAANDYPRFERQIVRAVHDEGILTGAKQPHPELLRRYPNREYPHSQPPQRSLSEAMGRHRPGTGRSAASGRSQHSETSSRRSRVSAAGSTIAASVASSGPPPGYLRQMHAPPNHFTTSSATIGGGGRVAPEPLPGREVWMLGRGGGQQSSFDSCLVKK